eukprot:459490_1
MAQELKDETHMSSATPGQTVSNDLDLHWVVEEMKECVDDGIVNWSTIKKLLFPSISNNQSHSPIDKDHIVALRVLKREIQHHFAIYVKQKLKNADLEPDSSTAEHVKWLIRQPYAKCKGMDLPSISDISKKK